MTLQALVFRAVIAIVLIAGAAGTVFAVGSCLSGTLNGIDQTQRIVKNIK